MSDGVTVSIVSHLHGDMVLRLVNSLLELPSVRKIVLTKNVPEKIELPDSERLMVICNESAKGFSENHNFAFAFAEGEFFCVMNPDVSFDKDPFPELFAVCSSDGVGIVAPRVVSRLGVDEDSARNFPTFGSLIRKLIFGDKGNVSLAEKHDAVIVDWVAGMFMLFTRDSFSRLGGFDKSFFLYYEDVDICVRAWQFGLMVKVCPLVSVVHDARRASRKNFRYALWHLKSMARYMAKHFGRLPSISE
ncbi:glycosyltransferase family 2 protein [Permianibacter aggregans]|uniref:Glycosyltransferase 2-like domain-containing protein n=1 Tax=Permianibacter aggregans TaxID=1510150 RepID=A0A4R6UXU9_9GAMM|nr:glycosyltransferase family 2 protein [Permianibacter aggregans]QGX41339.1 glycosyltransferase family 2 protein [Permianibacter aggregans]TDQ51126.1 hypothetical protein EV696_10195 [Permianibacter aggregans]